MYFTKEEQRHEIKSNLKGGAGDLDFRHIVPQEMLYGAGTQICVVTFEPGQSIGVHGHTENYEIYYILEGEVTVTDDDEERVLKPGDSEICANGHIHSVCNKTDKPVKILAIIMNNFDRLKG